MRVILLLLIFSSWNGFAAPRLANFVPGHYKPIEGAASQCVGGRFVYSPSGDGVQLGSLHNFSLRTNSMVLDSDIPEEKDCKYDVRDRVDVIGRETVLSFREILRCPGVVRHQLLRSATITADKITIEYAQTVNPDVENEESLKYRCVFQRVK